MRKFTILVTIAAAGMALADVAPEGLEEEKGSSPWHLTIGPVLAPRVRVRVRGASPAAMVRPAVPAPSSGRVAGIAADPSEGFTAREYADGYVKPDEGTADPDTLISGLTWNWGADNVPAQYSDGNVEFRTEMARWTQNAYSSSYSQGSLSDSDRDVLLGIEAMGGFMFFEDEDFDAAIDAGLRYYGSDDQKAKSQYGTSVTTTRSEYRIVDSYDASAWTEMPIGAYTGSAGGPGRLIGATPTRKEELIGTSSVIERYRYYSDTKLDYRIWDLRLGPTVGWKATDWLTLRGGVYGLLGIVDAKLKSETGTEAGAARGAAYSQKAKKSKCETVFGLAAGLSAQVKLTDNLFLAGGVEYDWWSDSVTLRAGGADARIKLSDITMSLALGYQF